MVLYFCRWVADVPPREPSLIGDERGETSAVRRLPCTKLWFFPSKFCKFSLFMKVLKIGIFGLFLAKCKMPYLAIFLANSNVSGMPYLPAKDELVSLNCFSSRGLWKTLWKLLLTEYEEFRNFSFDGKFSILTDSRSYLIHTQQFIVDYKIEINITE